VCGEDTGHAEVVFVVFDPSVISYEGVLKVFWEGHDPTQDTRQSNDVRPQYRSVVFVSSDRQRRIANASRDRYEEKLSLSGRNRISTEMSPALSFYFAESDHRQYLAKNPSGYWHCVYVSLNTMANPGGGKPVRRSGRDNSVIKSRMPVDFTLKKRVFGQKARPNAWQLLPSIYQLGSLPEFVYQKAILL
jgi:methionine-S-sulfoxide reductase